MKISDKIFLSFLAILLIYAALFVVREFIVSSSNNKFAKILPLSGQNLLLQAQINSVDSLEFQIDSYVVIGSKELKEAIISYPQESSQDLYKLIEDQKTRDEFGTIFLELSDNINSLIRINEQPQNKSDMNSQIIKTYESIDKLKTAEIRLLDSRTNELQQIIKGQQDTTKQITQLFLYTSVFVFAVGFFLSILLSRKITKPIKELTATAQAIAGGDLTKRASVASGDEVGQLAESFNKMVENVLGAEKEKRDVTEEYAQRLEKSVEEKTLELQSKVKELNGLRRVLEGLAIEEYSKRKKAEKIKKDAAKENNDPLNN
jgi:methyl-accepting chemotaxis protein